MPKYTFVLPVIRQLSLTFPPRHIALAPHSTAKHSACPSNAAEGCRGFSHIRISSVMYSVRQWTHFSLLWAGGAGISSEVMKGLVPSIGSVACGSAQVGGRLLEFSWVKAVGSIQRCRSLETKKGLALQLGALSINFWRGYSLLWFMARCFSLLHSLPPRWVFLLPQREHDGVSLPLPAVSQLPALSGLLLEGPCQRFPQQPAPNERVHVMGKGRLAPRCRLRCPPTGGETPGRSSRQPSGTGRLGAGQPVWIGDPVREAPALGALGRTWRWEWSFLGEDLGRRWWCVPQGGQRRRGWQQGTRLTAASPIPTGLTVKSSLACSVWLRVNEMMNT